MDDHSFAEALCSWIHPRAVEQASERLAESPEMLVGLRYEAWLPRLAPLPASATGLDQLIQKFLRGFHLPAEYLQLLAAARPKTPPAIWERLAEVRFEGEVTFTDFPPNVPPDSDVLVRANPVVTLLVAGPLVFLQRHTAGLLPLWSQGSAERQFFEHSYPNDFLTYLEHTVVSALGHEPLARSAEPRPNAQMLYGDGSIGISMIGQPPFGDLASRVRSSFLLLNQDVVTRWRKRSGIIDRLPMSDPGQPVPFDFDGPEVPVRPELTAADGFSPIEEAEAVQSWRNVARWRNECSPYAMMRSRTRSVGLRVERYYGRVFDFALEENFGIYGITEAMPEMPRAREVRGFLRTPYRKIPRYAVRSMAELLDCLNTSSITEDGSPYLYRGQTAEYRLPRSDNAREILYGDRDALEPSLLATSTRYQQPLEAVFPAWVELVRGFLQWLWANQLAIPEVADEVRSIIEADARRFDEGLDLLLYSISVAQHYGLPTGGLDVTEDLRTALFFALHVAEKGPNRTLRYHRKAAGDTEGVLYVFVPDERFRMIHDRCRPRTMGGGRPEQQGAQFMVTGWGYHQNAVARHLGIALYLDPAGDFGVLPAAADLFPARGQDLFGDYLEAALARGLPDQLQKYVEQLYWVEPV